MFVFHFVGQTHITARTVEEVVTTTDAADSAAITVILTTRHIIIQMTDTAVILAQSDVAVNAGLDGCLSMTAGYTLDLTDLTPVQLV